MEIQATTPVELLKAENSKLNRELAANFPGVFVEQETPDGKVLFLPSTEPFATIMLAPTGQYIVRSIDRAPRVYNDYDTKPLLDLVKDHPESDVEWWKQAGNTTSSEQPTSNSNDVSLNKSSGNGSEWFNVVPLDLGNKPEARIKLHMDLLQAQLNLVSNRMSRIDDAVFEPGAVNTNQILSELTQLPKK